MPAMRFPLLLTTLLCLAAPALAQIYSWKDESGRTVMSDKPPSTKAKSERVLRGSGTTETPAPATAAKPGVDPELEKRRRREQEQQDAEKKRADAALAEERKEACGELKRYVAMMESGERITRRDDNGERYYLDDDQKAQEVAKARARMAAAGCN